MIVNAQRNVISGRWKIFRESDEFHAKLELNLRGSSRMTNFTRTIKFGNFAWKPREFRVIFSIYSQNTEFFTFVQNNQNSLVLRRKLLRQRNRRKTPQITLIHKKQRKISRINGNKKSPRKKHVPRTIIWKDTTTHTNKQTRRIITLLFHSNTQCLLTPLLLNLLNVTSWRERKN